MGGRDEPSDEAEREEACLRVGRERREWGEDLRMAGCVISLRMRGGAREQGKTHVYEVKEHVLGQRLLELELLFDAPPQPEERLVLCELVHRVREPAPDHVERVCEERLWRAPKRRGRDTSR